MWYVFSGFRALFGVFGFSTLLLVAVSAMAEPSVLSYKEWKNSKIQTIESRIRQLEGQSQPTHRSADPNLKPQSSSPVEAQLSADLSSQIESEMTNLNLVQDLTITDYFVGYLTKQSAPEQAIKEVAAKLSTEEVAELMAAYAQHFAGPSPKSR